MKAKFKEWLVCIIFVIIGAGLISGGIIGAVSKAKFKDNALQTTATVVRVSKYWDSDVGNRYKAHISYTVDGTMYKGSFSANYHISEGSTKTIYYDKNNPNKMSTTTSSWNEIIMSVFGIPFCVIGLKLIRSKFNELNIKKRTYIE